MRAFAAFARRWRYRLDFLARETGYQAHGLASLLAALAAAPAEGGPVLVLVATPAQARFLARLAPLVCAAPCTTRLIADLADLERCMAESAAAEPRRLLLANELYARFHAQLAPDLRARRLAVA